MAIEAEVGIEQVHPAKLIGDVSEVNDDKVEAIR